MRCPICGEIIVGLDFAVVGQTMCPNCGEVIDITDMNNSDSKTEED